MSQEYLMVPIHLDALWLDQETAVAEAMANFSKLPWFDGQRDHNFNYPFISEEILSPPFQNQNLYLKPGMHLHWAMPDALTKIKVDESGNSSYSQLPNRWMVVRMVDDQTQDQWIIESDYMYPEGEGGSSGAVNFPKLDQERDIKEAPYCFLGRKLPLDTWAEDARAERLSSLTAFGYGEPAFAAFYPSCRSMFGYFDDQHLEMPAEEDKVSYIVVGWYSDLDNDPLYHYLSEYPGAGDKGDYTILEYIKEGFQWTTEDEILEDETSKEEVSYVARTLCYGKISIEPQDDISNPAFTAQDTQVTVATTGMEAFSAYLANEVDPTNRLILEEQLEAFQMAYKFSGKKLDIGAQFREERHTQGFNALSGGQVWSIISESTQTSNADAETAHAQSKITLPDDLAHEIHELNQLQQAFDRANEELESLQTRLFADWYKYMLCTYPPDDSRDEYPDPDEVKWYIQEKGMQEIVDKEAELGATELLFAVIDGTQMADAQAAAPGSLAYELAEKYNFIQLKKLAPINASEETLAAEMQYLLLASPAQRFWQTNEPVMLVTGEATKATHRHGQDGREHEEGYLNCYLIALGENDTPETPFDTNQSPVVVHPDLLDRLIDIIPQEEVIGHTIWQYQPWNPFLLEWQVEIYPMQEGANINSEDRCYNLNFININYDLPENSAELLLKEGPVSLQKSAHVFTGRVILTPYANSFLKEQLWDALHTDDFEATIMYVYFDSWYFDEYFVVEEPADFDPEENIDEYLLYTKNIDDLLQWFDRIYLSDIPNDADRSKYYYYTLVRAYRELLDMNGLSQALSGFNEALQMQKMTLQLDPVDPLAFEEYRAFTDQVADLLKDKLGTAPLPQNDFSPIRTGEMKILKLRLVDNFGQGLDLDVSDSIKSETLSDDQNRANIHLPPRLSQPARLNFFWRAAFDGDVEMNSHPLSSPVCGWILPNNLDNSLFIYNQKGEALGLISQTATWKPAPGSIRALTKVAEISNPTLRQVVEYVIGRGESFLQNFISSLDSAMENIEPENYAQHQSLALLMGQPLALVRTSINLELKGLPAVNQDWNAFYQDMDRSTREHDGFQKVRFPVRLGEYMQFNDSLAGYWIEEDTEFQDNLFYAPQSDELTEDYINTRSEKAFEVELTLEGAATNLTMLVDPRGAVHATSGILPVNELSIPPEQYAQALKSIEISFLSTPIITDKGSIKMPLPKEPGYKWSWLSYSKNSWAETEQIYRENADAVFPPELEIVEGWLKLKPDPDA